MILSENELEALFKSHFKGLCKFADSYLKDYEVSKEIVQDAFVSLWMKRESIDPEKQVKSYLTTTVRNKCLNYLRDNRKFNKELVEIESRFETAFIEQPDFLVQSELRSGIDNAIQELPEKCRHIFILNRFENLRYQQIAEKLNISVKTVETQMSKALSHLRTRLSEFLPSILLLLTLLPFYHLSTLPFDNFPSLIRVFTLLSVL